MKKNNKWLMFLILLISAITVGVSQLKIAAVMQDVAAALGVSTTQAALLMSVFTIAGIVLAIPGAAIQDKMGPKNLLLLLMVWLQAMSWALSAAALQWLWSAVSLKGFPMQ